MRILVYCQYVLGMGHLSRSLAVAGGLAPSEVLLVLGGPEVGVRLPPNVRPLRLPVLEMDEQFKGVYAPDGQEELEERKARRCELLRRAARDFDPDAVLVELYPFGRRAFEFELIPFLEDMRQGRRRAVVSACRDILVEKSDPAKFAARVNDRLARFFDAVLVHGDKGLVRLEETFAAPLAVPVEYTGYVAPSVPLSRRDELRAAYGIGPGEKLILASAGGGRVGFELPEATLAAFACLPAGLGARLRLYAGPFCPQDVLARLRAAASTLPGALVERFTPDFDEELAACDLSVSLAGYNTVMGVLAAGCRALVLPFAQNREQAMRARRLEGAGLLHILSPDMLKRDVLAEKFAEILSRDPPDRARVSLNGVQGTAFSLNRLFDKVNS